MTYQQCTCGNHLMTEIVITKNFDVRIEADGFADVSSANSVYPEPAYMCQNKDCGKVYVLDNGVLVSVPAESFSMI